MSLLIEQDSGTKVVPSLGAQASDSRTLFGSHDPGIFAQTAAGLFAGPAWASPQVCAHHYGDCAHYYFCRGLGTMRVGVWAGLSTFVQMRLLHADWSLGSKEMWGRMRAMCLFSALCRLQAVSEVSRLLNESFHVITVVHLEDRRMKHTLYSSHHFVGLIYNF